jgi:hypothetical protein
MYLGKRIAVVLAAATSLALGVAGTAAAATGPGNGSAFGVQVTVLGGTIALPPTPLVVTPPGGQQTLLNVGAGGVNVAGVAVSSQGSGGNVSSSAGILGATVPSFLTAQAITSSCTSTPTSASGTSQLIGASSPLTGPVAVNPPPNTSIPVVVGTMTLNEQQSSPNSIRVRAVHVAASPVADVILAESDCGLTLVGAANATAASATSAASAGMPKLAG